MTIKEDYWQSIFKQYEASGLSHKDFCLRNKIPKARFDYRWRKQLEKNKKSGIDLINAEPNSVNGFESISIGESPSATCQPEKPGAMTIHLPNQIRCEFHIDFTGKQFGALLSQLVALC